jgi:hypothetical protein
MMQIRANLRASGVSTATFAELIGVPLSSMKAAFAGKFRVGSTAELDYLNISNRLVALTQAIAPMAVSDVDALRQLLESNRTPVQLRSWVAEIF